MPSPLHLLSDGNGLCLHQLSLINSNGTTRIRAYSLDDSCCLMTTLRAPWTGQLVGWWPIHSVMPALHSASPTALETHGALGCQSPTSIVVFAVAAGGFHGRVTASSSPAQLADAMPPVQVQGTSAVAVAQARATLCKAKQPESGADQPRAQTAHTHSHLTCQLTGDHHSRQHTDALGAWGCLSLELPLTFKATETQRLRPHGYHVALSGGGGARSEAHTFCTQNPPFPK